MTEKKCQLTEKLRNYVYRYGTELSDDKLKKMGTSLEEINENFSDMEDIAKSIFEQERIAFEKIFKEYDFDGWNAIDILLLVGNEIHQRFFNVSPSVSYKLPRRSRNYSNSTNWNVPILSMKRLKLTSKRGCNKVCIKTTYQVKWLPACILPN